MGKLDAALKHAMSEFPRHWVELFGVRPGVPLEVVDVDLSTIVHVADKAILVRDDPPFLFHLEPQGYYDEYVDERVHLYNGGFRRRYGVFVHTVLLVLAPEAWGPANTGRIQAESPLGHCRIDFTYQVVKVWELPLEQIFAGGAGVLPLAPIADVPKSDLPQVVERMTERFEQEVPPAEAAELWTATYLLIGLKYDRGLAGILLRGVHDIMKESDTYLAILEEGMEKGLQKGREEGREEGRAEAKRHALVLIGTRRLGEPDEQTLAAIDATSDLARLDAMLLRVLDAEHWNDVLAAR